MATSPSNLTARDIVRLYEEGSREFCNLDFTNTMEFEGCNLDDIDFSGSFIDGFFTKVSLRNARFCIASIKTVVFKECDLTFANFKKSGLEGAVFEDCKATHACFDLASVYKPLKLNSMPPGMTR